MNKYILADIRRVLHKQSFLYSGGAFAGIFAAMVFVYYNPTFTAELYVSKISSLFSFFPLIVGLFVFMSVYADDFKCCSMQVAIGYGMERWKIIVAKLLESALLLLCWSAVMEIFVLAAPVLLGLAPDKQQLAELALTILVEMLRSLGYCAISTVPAFLSQNVVSGIIIYVLLSSKTIYILLTMLLGQTFLVNAFGDLTKYIYSVQLYTVKSAILQNASFVLALFLSLLCYVVLPTVIAILGFKKQELEF